MGKQIDKIIRELLKDVFKNHLNDQHDRRADFKAIFQRLRVGTIPSEVDEIKEYAKELGIDLDGK